jgi:hypothetical protein
MRLDWRFIMTAEALRLIQSRIMDLLEAGANAGSFHVENVDVTERELGKEFPDLKISKTQVTQRMFLVSVEF